MGRGGRGVPEVDEDERVDPVVFLGDLRQTRDLWRVCFEAEVSEELHFQQEEVGDEEGQRVGAVQGEGRLGQGR